jgi:hypothetical protein
MLIEKTDGSRIGERFARRLWNDHKKAFLFAFLAAALLLYGDILLPLLGHGLHVLIEVLELSFEHFVEWAFGLAGHQAQMVTGWTGFLLAAYLAVKLLRKACRLAERAATAAAVRWANFKAALAADFRLKLALSAGAALVAAAFLMF